MRLIKKEPKVDQVKKWLMTLQEKFGLNEGESKELYAITHTCFAHNLDEIRVKRVLFNFLIRKGYNPKPDEIESSSIFTFRAGTRRYGKWSWQENAFGILAYLLTALFFRIDIIFSPDEQSTVAVHQFCAASFVLIVWCLLDKCSRARPETIILFDAANRFMPGFTLVSYLCFHLCKLMFFHMGIGWLWGMKVVGMAYVGLGAVLIAINLVKYAKVAELLN